MEDLVVAKFLDPGMMQQMGYPGAGGPPGGGFTPHKPPREAPLLPSPMGEGRGGRGGGRGRGGGGRGRGGPGGGRGGRWWERRERRGSWWCRQRREGEVALVEGKCPSVVLYIGFF